MQFFERASGDPKTLGILPGTFNPPTRAHVALARAALSRVDQVLFVLPRTFPHKSYEGAAFDQRVSMLQCALRCEPAFSIATSENGLFIEIARGCRDAYGPQIELFFLCGRDAAERIVNWDYGRPGAIAEQLKEYGLLVAPRRGRYQPPAELESRIATVPIEPDCDGLSATEVRERIKRGEPWEHLVPESIIGLAREIYS